MSERPAFEAAAVLPGTLRLECKFTTGNSIRVPTREIEALRGRDPRCLGAIAALFWDGRRDSHDGWLFIGAAESAARRSANVISFNEADVARLDRTQHWLDCVRHQIRRRWPPFVCAFHDLALAGHERLHDELRELHGSNALVSRFSQADGEILDDDCRCAMKEIIQHHGASGAGRIFQDLLAYVLGTAGYRTVRINPVGVPDIEVTDLGGYSEGEVHVKVTRSQYESLVELSERAGDAALLQALRLQG